MNDRFIAGGTLSLVCPEGFHVMTADELAKMNFFGGETGEKPALRPRTKSE